MKQMCESQLVFIESPYRGDLDKHMEYAIDCMKDCLLRNEVPFVAHLLYTKVGKTKAYTGDTKEVPRDKGLELGLTVAKRCDKIVVYTDLGISSGMDLGIKQAKEANIPVEYRKLGGTWTRPEDLPVGIHTIVEHDLEEHGEFMNHT